MPECSLHVVLAIHAVPKLDETPFGSRITFVPTPSSELQYGDSAVFGTAAVRALAKISSMMAVFASA
jgi:hypothetical protein